MTPAVAALFVSRKGPYWDRPGVDAWDEERDARKYRGELPVVAHPPCNLWVNFAALNYKRYGGEHNRPGNDQGCFASAVANLLRVGGVLEHPAGSKAWLQYGLPVPHLAEGWRYSFGVWSCEVWQSAYGHKARKRTWLAYVGCSRPADLDWTRKHGSHQCGWFDRNKPTLGKAEASATPPLFAEALIQLARLSRTARNA